MQLIDILSRLISIKSVSGNEKNICLWIKEFLLTNGFDVEFQEVEKDRWNIFAKKGNPKMLFFGHLDTVPPVANWINEPFKLTIKNDQAIGLGCWDMKGGIATILKAAESEENFALLFSVDEEEISKGGWKAIENKKFFEGINGIISAEAGNEKGTYGGVTHLAYARSGRIAYKMIKSFSAGHAATIDSNWIEWIYKKSTTLPKYKSRIVIRNFHATSNGLSVPELTTTDIDVLIHPNESEIDFKRILENHFEAVLNEIKRETPYLKPYSFEENNFIKKVSKVVEEKFGKPSLHIGSSVGDENALALLGIPIVIIGPEGRNEHAADEWVSIKSLNQICELYKILNKL